MTRVNDYLPLSRRDYIAGFNGARRAWAGTRSEARVTNADIDVIQWQNFTASELLQYEALGLACLGR